MELADIGSLFGLDGIVEDVKDVAILAGSAAAGMVAAKYVFQYAGKIPVVGSLIVNNKPWAKLALGVAAAIALGRYVHRGVGAGVGAGIAGSGLVDLVTKFMPSLAGLSASDEILLGLQGFKTREISGGMSGLGNYADMGGLGVSIRDVQSGPMAGLGATFTG